MKSIEMTRFDARLTKEQKEFFEYASRLGGFRSLTEFIIKSVQSKAEQLVEEHNKIIASNRDREIFFDFVFKGVKPNKELKSALKEYNKLL
ncbi:MAG TPA: DUF1778 domain-containing protein [Bacteroidetes bacterium]|nr:DUF1778 domain-containing protein [Bacteroidota bacterium]